MLVHQVCRIAAAVVFVLAAPAAFGWGCEGHQTIAIMAENMLPGTIGRRINQILAEHPGPQLPRRFCDVSGLSPMAQAATWADDYRDLDRSSAPLHFVDIPLDLRGAPDWAAYCKDGCILDAIKSNIEKLKTAKNDEERATALRFIIHFVGDVHQPMHSSTNNDHGGNCVPVSYFTNKATVNGPKEDASPNLHGLWDTSILRTLMRRKDFTVETLADHLQAVYARRMRRWAAERDPKAWAIDAFERSRTVAYGALPAHIRPEEPQEVKTCADDNHVSKRMQALDEHIDDVYLDAAVPVVEAQLAKAAARLEKALEEAFQ